MPSFVPGSVGADRFSLAMDPFGRTLIGWVATGGSPPGVQLTGAFLSPSQVAGLLGSFVSALPPESFVGGNASTEKSNLTAALASLQSHLGHGSDWGSLHQFLQTTYPRLSDLPLRLDCSNASADEGGCPGMLVGPGPTWILNESGPTGPSFVLGLLSYWLAEAIGEPVLNDVPGDPTFPGGVVEEFLDPTTADLLVPLSAGTNYDSVVISIQTYSGTVLDEGATIDGSMASLVVTGLEPSAKWLHWNSSVTTTSVTLICHGPPPRPDGMCIVGSSTFTMPGPSGVLVSPYLSMAPALPTVEVLTSALGGTTLSAHWNNTALVSTLGSGFSCAQGGPARCEIVCSPSACPGAYASPLLTDFTSGLVQIPANPNDPTDPTSYSFQKDFFFAQGFSPRDHLQLSGNETTSDGGAFAPSGTPSMGGSVSAPPFTESFSCGFLADFASTVWGLTVNSAGSNTVSISWFSPQMGTGTATVTGAGYIDTLSTTATPVPGSTNGTYAYVAVFGGLDPFSAYTATVSASHFDPTDCGGATYTATRSDSFLSAPTLPTVSEQDLPYDSLTQEGGGAELAWSIPTTTLSELTFQSGDVTYTGYPFTNATNVPLTALPPTPPSTPGYFELNLSVGLWPSTTYSAAVMLNFTAPGYQGNISVVGATGFDYHEDHSGDGLTDVEKEYGWSVATTDASGSPAEEHVSANIYDYATNGLVNDFLEKQFGLNPNTLDTAGSHMLDTWNLTFDLGRNPVPAQFRTWHEAGAGFDPYSFPQLPNTYATAPGDPTGAPPLNFSDSSPWASDQLWTYHDLTILAGRVTTENVGWLRAVTGNLASGEPTLTVWGKLSWGANPLAASTPRMASSMARA